MTTDIIVTVLSWEDRYILGLEKNIAQHKPAKVIALIYKTNKEWKESNLHKTRDLLKDGLLEVSLDGLNTQETWFTFLKVFKSECAGKNILIDITTMPREAIWLSLYNSRINRCHVSYIYYKPKSYSADWISRDPGKPRLLYKMSGISKLGAPTLLLITGGYDIQRLDSLIYNFEPKHTMLLFQNGNDSRNIQNFEDCKTLFRKKYSIDSIFQYDPYDVDLSVKLILEKVNQAENGSGESYINKYNIIFNSLGAKTSAISLFKIWLQFPQVALSYIPSKEYNKDYSIGIGDSHSGTVNF